MPTTLPTLTRENLVDLDLDDVPAVKARIRELTGIQRVSRETLGEFLEEAEALLSDAEDEEPSEGRSVVKKSYKTRYKPFRSTCGDDLAAAVRRHLEVKTEDGLRIDPVKLRDFALANECWVETYEQLNVGMRRMNVVNRLRAKVRKGHEVLWA